MQTLNTVNKYAKRIFVFVSASEIYVLASAVQTSKVTNRTSFQICKFYCIFKKLITVLHLTITSYDETAIMMTRKCGRDSPHVMVVVTAVWR